MSYGCLFFRLVPGADVVKGLNTLSAWALQNGLLAGKQVRGSGMLGDVSGINEEKAGKLHSLKEGFGRLEQ